MTMILNTISDYNLFDKGRLVIFPKRNAIAIHRKNCLFSASEAGAEAYAIPSILTQTAL